MSANPGAPPATTCAASASTPRTADVSPMSTDIWQAPPCALVIFGASGDLTSRKLVPALFNLWRTGFLRDPFHVIGVSRSPKSDDAFRQELREAAAKHSRVPPESDGQWSRFASHIGYESGDLEDMGLYSRLRGRLDAAEKDAGRPLRRLYYLAIAPPLFGDAVDRLAQSGLAHSDPGPGAARVVVEKPFGRDLASAQELSRDLTKWLDERQILRIDHYLGKETVQDILAFRFGNSIFEPLFNRRYVDHIQITVAEAIGMEGKRGAYYDASGALRDMVQNHMLQLLCLVAMEPPVAFEADAIHIEKVKVLRALTPLNEAHAGDVVRGQYGAGIVEGQSIKSYRECEGVAADSMTETYVAMKIAIENWRWSQTPFYLRTGKCLPKRMTEIAVQFRRPPLRFFEAVGPQGDRCDIGQAQPNQLIFRIQPDEGISLYFASKSPGMRVQLQTVEMDFDYGKDREGLPEAYERLLLDALRGDSTLFTRSDEVEYAWRFVDSIRTLWAQSPAPRFPNYPAGTWGPPDADRLFHGGHCVWRRG